MDSLYGLAVTAGILAGFINTLAGSGSLVTLPMMMFMGLPASVANGTNRLGVMFQCATGILKFRESGHLVLADSRFLLIPTVLGSCAGAFIAIDLDEKMMRAAIAVVMILMLVVILLKPNQWLRQVSDQSVRIKSPANFLLFFAIGAYGGFIQAGVGLFLLAGLVMRCGFSMLQASVIKLCLVLTFTIPALIIFFQNGLVDLKIGLILAFGQSIGAWLAARFAVENKNATFWMRRLLIAIILFSIVKLLAFSS